MAVFKWLYPGMRVKRWLFFSTAGILLAALGAGILLGNGLVEKFAFFLSRLEGKAGSGACARCAGALLIVLGVAALSCGFLKVLHSVAASLLPEQGGRAADIVYARQHLRRGPKIVVIGGGTGLSVLLRGLKEFTSNITAIVTVADDGGSSGRLRERLGVQPPGDIRNCLAALADAEPLMGDLLQYRFKNGELAGHTVGNLLLAALSEMTGDMDRAVRSLSKVLAVRGQVLPATLSNVTLCAETADGTLVQGESNIARCGRRIARVFLKPARCWPLPGALAAIREADGIVLGPGSLYTSIIPNLLVKGVPEALARSRAVKIFVCNIMTQPGETDGYRASEHARAIIEHAGKVIDWAVINTGPVPKAALFRYRQEGSGPVEADLDAVEALGIRAVGADLVQQAEYVRHHSQKLARLILDIILAARAGRTTEEEEKTPKISQVFF